MFLNNIKDFFIKNKVKKELTHYKHITSNQVIKSIGIIIDESIENKKELLVSSILNKGFSQDQVRFIVHKTRLKKNETYDYPIVSNKDVNVNLDFSSSEVNSFINTNFDLLISYYDIEIPTLMALTLKTKSNFKVGFSQVDERLNQFMIDTDKENVSVFINELFKYLQILNKI